MNRIKRRRLTETAALGVTLTLLVVLVDHYGLLHSLDEWAYDRRVRDCQIFSKPPTDRLVHLDVDDRAIEVIGRWPWSRARQAEILEELHRAGPKVVAMDLHLSRPEEAENDAADGGSKKASRGDLQFAEALKHLGSTVISMEFQPPDPLEAVPLAKALHAELLANLELTESGLIDRLLAGGFEETKVLRAVATRYIQTRRTAIFERVVQSLDAAPADVDALAKRLLTEAAAEVNSPLKRELVDQYNRAVAERGIRRFGIPVATTARDSADYALSMVGLRQVPLLEFSSAVEDVGFVDWKFDWQVCRSVPLLLNYDHRLYPQFGLVVACRMLDVDPRNVQLEDNRLVIPKPDGTRIVIPLRTGHWEATGQDVPALMDIPFFGTPRWTTSFDWPNYKNTKQHISMNLVWDAVLIRRRLALNNKNIDDAIERVLTYFDDKEAIDALKAKPVPRDDSSAGLPRVKAVLNRSDVKSILEVTAGSKPEDLTSNDKICIDAIRFLQLAPQQNLALAAQLDQKRAELTDHVKNKAVLIGWTSDTTSADFVPTAMHPVCPGVVVHGTIVNAILTNRFWYAAPGWVTVVITLFAGIVTAGAAATLSPSRGFAVAFAVAVGYFLLNGLVIFGIYHVTLGLAGPICVVAIVWSACTLSQVLLETKERAVVERRFRSYVDPSLVEHCVEHPELTHLEGEIREVSVCFTDLVGFTTISEKLGANIVALLNEYWREMIPIVRRNNGFVAKFMGDGLFFFFGAPRVSQTHAPDAVKTILEMQEALGRFNLRTAARGLPPLGMRAGCNTGNAVVGDAGAPPDASDYTALGDVTNLGARLEGANKGFGTRNLITQATADRCADRFLLRPVGRLCVFGKTTGVPTYESLCPKEQATDEQRRWVALSAAVVDTFQNARFEDCLKAIGELESHAGPTRMTALYRSLSEGYRSDPPHDFDGCIVLNEK
jgi:class 3 adenylate cyclase/CHASE2 domain-containing sensor protein